MRKTLLFLPLLLVLGAAPVMAHDWVKVDGTKVSARWIMNNPLTSYCCGPEDCEPVPGRVTYTPAGWAVRGLKGSVKMGDTYPSIDGQPWACRYVQTNRIRCLFLPESRN